VTRQRRKFNKEAQGKKGKIGTRAARAAVLDVPKGEEGRRARGGGELRAARCNNRR
jgi:hypothetical protein